MTTVHVLKSQLDHHLTECVEENRRTQVVLHELKDGHAKIMTRLDELNRAGWKAVGAIGLIVLGGLSSTIVGLLLLKAHS